MAVFKTELPYPYLLFQKQGWRGIPLDILVVRTTFELGKDGEPMRLAAHQTPLQLGDEHDGPFDTEPLATVLKNDGDLVAGKRGTDIILTGHLHSPGGKPATDWIAAVRVGDVKKGLRVTGPRTFKRTLFGWRTTRAVPVESVPLDYRLAFGGRVDIPGSENLNQLSYAQNPAGVGWLPNAADMQGLSWRERRAVNRWAASQQQLTAPQFEDYDAAIRGPAERPRPQGFGAIARWWQPRLAYQGTLDEAWRKERCPLPPDDYDPRYTSSAHPELIAPRCLAGDELVVLAQCLPEGRVETALPGNCLLAHTAYANGRLEIVPLGLDTIRIDLDTRTCVMLWRGIYSRANPPKAILITEFPVKAWRALLAEKARIANGQD